MRKELKTQKLPLQKKRKQKGANKIEIDKLMWEYAINYGIPFGLLDELLLKRHDVGNEIVCIDTQGVHYRCPFLHKNSEYPQEVDKIASIPKTPTKLVCGAMKGKILRLWIVDITY